MNAKPVSIQAKLAVRLGILFAFVFVAASLMLYFRYRVENSSPPTETLTEHVAEFSAALRRDDSGNPVLDLPATATKGIDYVIRDESGGVLLASSDEVVSRLGEPPDDWDRAFYQDYEGPNGESLFGVIATVTSPIGKVKVQLAELDSVLSAETKDAIDELFEEVMPLLLPFAAAALVIGLMTIRTSFAPLRTLAQQAAKITPVTTTQRLDSANVPKELLPLVTAINGALDRLDAGFRLQREFTADAAHELRTPLAILTAHLDNLDDMAAAEALRPDVDRMSRLVGQLLSVARLEALSIGQDETADLQVVAVDVVSALAPLALRQNKEIGVSDSSAPVLVHGNADALHQAVRNLAENALQHTPEGTSVDIEVSAEPAIHVIDHGSGVPASLRANIGTRFWRGGRDKRGHEGYGLGLSIADRIATLHGGRLEYSDAAGGGARFSIILNKAGPRHG